MKNKKVKNLILGILIVSILGYLYYQFYLSKEIVKINALRQDIQNTKTKIITLNQKKLTVDAEIKQEKDKSLKLNDAIPDTYDKKVIIAYFYNLIKQYSLTGDRVSFAEPEKADKGFRTVSVNFKVDGDNENIKDFVKAIEDDKRKYVVKQINVGQSSSGGYSCSLSIDFYALN